MPLIHRPPNVEHVGLLVLVRHIFQQVVLVCRVTMALATADQVEAQT
jgi:hypothetical protein